MKNPIFVIGLPRSGSTLLENIIAKNPNVFRLAEALYLTPWRKDFRYFIKKIVGDLNSDKNVIKMVDIIFTPHDPIPGITGSFWRFENIKAYNEEPLKDNIRRRILESDRSLENIFKILIEEITYYNGYRRCCIAFPVYPNYVDELFRWYPQAKIIHNTRDPRGVAISKTNDPSGAALIKKKYPMFKFAIRKLMITYVIVQYIWVSRLHQKYKDNENYTLFQYENLLSDPEAAIKRLCHFAQIDFTADMLEPDMGMRSSLSNKRFKGINKKLGDNWRKVITPSEKYFITFLTKNSMKRFGVEQLLE